MSGYEWTIGRNILGAYFLVEALRRRNALSEAESNFVTAWDALLEELPDTKQLLQGAGDLMKNDGT